MIDHRIITDVIQIIITNACLNPNHYSSNKTPANKTQRNPLDHYCHPRLTTDKIKFGGKPILLHLWLQ